MPTCHNQRKSECSNKDPKQTQKNKILKKKLIFKKKKKRIGVKALRVQPDHIGLSPQLKILHLITSLKIPFPNKVTFFKFQGLEPTVFGGPLFCVPSALQFSLPFVKEIK